MMSENDRSDFVTVLAWISILISGLMTYGIITQMFITGKVLSSLAANTTPEDNQAFITITWIASFASLSGAIAILLSSVGLLKRKNWARIIFILMLAGLFIGSIGASLAGLVGLFYDFSQFLQFQNKFDSGTIASLVRTVSISFFILCVGATALMGWSIKKLTSKNLNEEFKAEA